MTGFQSEVGFSIKSKHSSSATLINASGQTLFQYRINPKVDNKGINEAREALSVFEDNEKQKVGPKERVARLFKSGYELSFNRMKSEHFQENLQLIDSSLDVFLSDCLLVFMQEKISSLADIVKLVAKRNPCNYVAREESRLLDFYQYKMKRLIVDAALGMQPKIPWTGEYDEKIDIICEGQISISSIDSIKAIVNQIKQPKIYETNPNVMSGGIYNITITFEKKKLEFVLHNASHPKAKEIIKIVNSNIPLKCGKLFLWKDLDERDINKN